MGITDSSAALDTSWTENSISDFTAGVLSDIDACVTEVGKKLKRGTLGSTTTPTDTDVKNWLKRAKLELMEIKNYTFARKYAYCDLTAGTYRYAMPEDYNGGEVTLKDTTNDQHIEIWPASLYDKMFPDPSEEENDDVSVACIKNMELWVAPPPDSSDRLEVEYARSGAETTADDFSWLPELERFRCCDFAIAEGFESLHMWAESDRYWGKWNQGLAKSRVADNRRKWWNRHNQALNVFQEKRIRDYQGGRYYRPR